MNGKNYKIHLYAENGIGCTGTKIPSITIVEGNITLADKIPLADCDTYGVDMIKMLPNDGYIQFMGHNTDNIWKHQIYDFVEIIKSPATQAFKK